MVHDLLLRVTGCCPSKINPSPRLTLPTPVGIVTDMSNTTTTATERRTCTTATITRADQLRLADQIIVTKWDGTVEVMTVTSLTLLNDDVEINGTLTTSIGNGFHVVATKS